ncbi:MAG: peptidylprolyl isomerase [Sulfurovaceae bacterium]|nr:peptidylprolyl isomerase [Sulfurovaceae bacterium]
MKKLFIAVVLTIFGLNISNAKEVANTAKATAKDPIVVLQTSAGNIELRLFPKAAPLAVKNFMTHAKNGYYNNVIFHRVIKGFMIQGGDPTGTGMGGESIWKKDFKNEYAPNLTFDRPFLLAMANAGPNTNGSQFFITTAATPFLNGGYTIFGEVINGKEVVKKIENAKTSPEDRPYTKQIIKKAFVK